MAARFGLFYFKSRLRAGWLAERRSAQGRIVLADEVRTIEPVAVRRVVSPKTARIMAELATADEISIGLAGGRKVNLVVPRE